MIRPVIIIGAGGHASVVADALLESGFNVIGFTDRNPRLHGTVLVGLPVLGEDKRVLAGHRQEEVMLANGLGGVGSNELRQQVQIEYEEYGWRFATVRHPSAVVSRRAMMADSVQLLAGSIVQIGAVVETGVIANTGAVIEHHCEIGRFVHVAPGALLCGGVKVGSGSHIGAGAVIKQGVRLGPNTLVGAGAVVLKDFEGNGMLLGAPARLAERMA
ncbi:acetyltransferase [Bradyrhizobium centrosematis]|uniref:acetyltransferase n=1 Tax=Bradyrhizobium centrosematis TaxID=1300039 RepID=UPI00216947F0|nr:acetyltransferase [Bradyrhizobium centrosematis]MCS3765315.1 sugar O-acyltransferase (sialic acid O-acetyltransferase NeuD family) [Bradyrhizobium centrosematis]MCS3773985.1 sugar O-acyltransferase (sialic acid O-acetyltransferase NeuD family) [Bradyrhizobium centrosematis]